MKTATAPLPPLRSVKVLTSCERIRYLALQLTNRTGLCPLGSCLHPFPRCASPGNLRAKSRHILSWLANERKVSVSTHRQALAALLFFYGKVLCTDLPGFRDRKTSAVAALAGGADPG